MPFVKLFTDGDIFLYKFESVLKGALQDFLFSQYKILNNHQ